MIRLRYMWLIPAVLLAGCNATPHEDSYTPSDDQQFAANTWMVHNIQDSAIHSAIVAQHSLYPYHFVTGRDTLNDLGLRDLAALAGYYKDKAGELNVRRGDANEELYAARVQFVKKRLAEAGVDAAAMSVVDLPSPGPGVRSERAIQIFKASEAVQTTSDTGGTSSSAGGTGAMTSGGQK